MSVYSAINSHTIQPQITFQVVANSTKLSIGTQIEELASQTRHSRCEKLNNSSVEHFVWRFVGLHWNDLSSSQSTIAVNANANRVEYSEHISLNIEYWCTAMRTFTRLDTFRHDICCMTDKKSHSSATLYLITCNKIPFGISTSRWKRSQKTPLGFAWQQLRQSKLQMVIVSWSGRCRHLSVVILYNNGIRNEPNYHETFSTHNNL